MRTPTMLALAAVVAAAPAGAQERFSLGGDRVAIFNLAGRVTVEPGTGGGVVVEVTRGGDDAARLEIDSDERDGWRVLRVRYPADEIVYRQGDRSYNTNFRVRADGTFGNWGGDDPESFGDVLRAIFGSGDGERVTIRGSGSGLEAHADLHIRVPAGQTLAIFHGAGEIEASNIDGRIRLDSHAGPIRARNMRGDLTLDTGSGSIELEGAEADVILDTGSGNVVVRDVRGDRITVDTGSGAVTGSGLEGRTVLVDTGSGAVQLDGVTADRLEVDTGSGRVGLRRISAPRLLVDTGSGGVDADLFGTVENVVIDTGSGSVNVRAPASLDATIELDSGSGGVRTDFDVDVERKTRNYLSGRIGRGNGRIVIDTGSGGIRLERQN